MTYIRKALGKIVIFICLLLLGGFFDFYGRTATVKILTTSYYLLLGVAFLGRLSDRIVNGRVRRLLMGVAWMMILFFLFRGMKYHAFREVEAVARGLWYCYYLPILFVPMLSFFVALLVDESEPGRFSKVFLPMFVITAGLALMVLTNDWHQLVFHFQKDFNNWDSTYEYGPFYLLIGIWSLLPFLGAVLILVRKCRLSAVKGLFWIPLLPICLGMLYMVTYSLGIPLRVHGINLIELPETACFTVACFWECCITIGLIPSNKGYEALFRETGTAAQIVDLEGNALYVAKGARTLTKEQLNCMDGVWLDRDTFLQRTQIHGGWTYWQSDFSELNQLNAKLKELEEQLSEETELIRLQNEIQEKRAELEEKNRVYDQIALGTQRQSQKIAALTEEAILDERIYEKCMKKVCFHGTYIKRYANLELLAENHAMLSARELGIAVAESTKALKELGIPAQNQDDTTKEFGARLLLECYEWIQGLWEQAAEELIGTYVRMTNDGCKVVLEAENQECVKRLLDWEEGNQVGKVTERRMMAEEHIVYAFFPFGKGGDANDAL